MTIRQQVEDAIFLAQHGRYVGALTVLMLAIAASSRRTFPKPAKSFNKPDKEMGDAEAFTLFLGGRIRKILFGDYESPDHGTSGICVSFRGKDHDLAYILYKYYRCELVHDGELPEDVLFAAVERSTSQLRLGNGGPQVSIGGGDKMVLDHGWIDVLIEAVVSARCNGREFGIQHFDLIPKPGVDADCLFNSLAAKYDTSIGRVRILRHAVGILSPISIQGWDDDALLAGFLESVRSGKINGGAITGLSSHGLTDWQGVLQKQGIQLLREIAANYQLVAVS